MKPTANVRIKKIGAYAFLYGGFAFISAYLLFNELAGANPPFTRFFDVYPLTLIMYIIYDLICSSFSSIPKAICLNTRTILFVNLIIIFILEAIVSMGLSIDVNIQS